MTTLTSVIMRSGLSHISLVTKEFLDYLVRYLYFMGKFDSLIRTRGLMRLNPNDKS